MPTMRIRAREDHGDGAEHAPVSKVIPMTVYTVDNLHLALGQPVDILTCDFLLPGPPTTQWMIQIIATTTHINTFFHIKMEGAPIGEIAWGAGTGGHWAVTTITEVVEVGSGEYSFSLVGNSTITAQVDKAQMTIIAFQK